MRQGSGGEDYIKSCRFDNFSLDLMLHFMKVNLIRKASIEDFMTHHARSRSSMNLFQQVLKVVNWETSNDIQSTFGKKVDTICNGKRDVRTHAEYDKLCNAGKNEMGICDVDLCKSKAK